MEEQQKKWKMITIPLVFLNLILIGGIIAVACYYFVDTSSDSDNPDQSDGQDKPPKEWKPQGDHIKTTWGENLNPENVWQDYPRPQLQRSSYTNLNGFWDYNIIEKGQLKPDVPDGKILVPFPIESSLSGVMKQLTEKQELWYEKSVTIKDEWKTKKHLLLHFEAVDYFTEVYVNFRKVGEHTGGYTPFYFDIINDIDFTQKSFYITVKVYDPTDKSYQSVGKQTLTPGGIWYTPSSGIWQTVWIEATEENYITNLNIETELDNERVYMTVELNSDLNLPLTISMKYKDKLVYQNDKHFSGTEISLQLGEIDLHPWSPDDPNLYDIEVILRNDTDGSTLDKIKSYTAIRKITAEPDSKGILRFKLNNKVLFHMGTLDQGYFPDGLYTPPSDEAQIYDIKKLKSLGFNTIRKHMKVENSRYYYHCDRLGMMVWQDMPAGDIPGSHWDPSGIDKGSDRERTDASKDNYYLEWEEIIKFGKFFQSIVIWTPFNEGWGQFETESVANFTKKLDDSRLVNSASGGNHRICGDILDIHNYPAPSYPFSLDEEVNVLGEYGGLGLKIKGHTWMDDSWAYGDLYKSKDEVTYKYIEFTKTLEELVQRGYSAAIYTQTTDCESEINGLITYDRKEMKIYEDQIKEANVHLINSLGE